MKTNTIEMIDPSAYRNVPRLQLSSRWPPLSAKDDFIKQLDRCAKHGPMVDMTQTWSVMLRSSMTLEEKTEVANVLLRHPHNGRSIALQVIESIRPSGVSHARYNPR